MIEKSDKKDLKENQIHRLIDCCNFTKNGNKFIFHSEDFKEYKNAKNKGKIIHFLPDNEDQLTTLNIRKTNHKLIKAVAEKEILNEKQNNLIQLERKFFTRVDKLDKKTNELTVWQLHS